MLDSVFITGGSRGIGESLVREFSALGFRTVFTYKSSRDKAEKLAGETNSHAVYCDISDEVSVLNAIRTAHSLIGDISILVNNAGISKTGLLSDMSFSQWREVQSVNTDGLFLVTNAVLPYMLKRKCGRIINISSVWGVHGASCEVAYSTSKAACIGFTKALSKELMPSGITVNAIAPGVVDTDMNSHYTEQDMQLILTDIPANRMAAPSEIAHLARFLASKDAEYITGQVIGIDGGFGA